MHRVVDYVLDAREMDVHVGWHDIRVHVVDCAAKDGSNMFLRTLFYTKMWCNVSYVSLYGDEFGVYVERELV